MKLEMICTGEEVLSGQILDTNAAWFANNMMEVGIEIQRRTTVGDRIDDLVDIFIERSQHADIILVNGGLGPTSDDLSAQAAALACGETLVENLAWRQQLENWFKQRNRPMPSSNLKQALLPQSAIMIDNPVGTACGFRLKLNKAWLFFTPGVPFEFKHMVKHQFLPFIQQTFPSSEPTQITKLLTLGCAESILADKLAILDLPDGIHIGYRSSMPYIEIKLFARGKAAIANLTQVSSKVEHLLGDSLVAINRLSLAEEVHDLMLKKGKTLSIAESCTGGLLTSNLIAFPGSSHYLQQGLVTYSNQAKMQQLSVPEKILEQYGAVSIETVEAMASGVRQLLNADYSLATSGIAGPEGGTTDKPVGTVAIALSTKEKTYSQIIHLSNRSRELVRKLSCAVAYDMLRRALHNKPVIVNYAAFTPD